MRWFGGSSNPTAPVRTPNDGTAWLHSAGCWSVGHWPGYEFRTTRSRSRTVAVIGPCGVTRADMAQLGHTASRMTWRGAGRGATPPWK
ncbi:hypothetical protein UA74_17785 [Actinoalloteichus fjordicus]|uniref:Uncharacterized protein n=1 Tax=Actinoalloteichus fjordicus TaxID=1612552 RepID=A0AAC9LEW6_9PSEU|nr:hypothetical protein UA74_17785 [Actinoalloteichus fjordicus]